jgi:hypothetical protein
MRVVLSALCFAAALALVQSAQADDRTYQAILTEITEIPLDQQGGPGVEGVFWYDNNATQFALLARTRTPECASVVWYNDVHNICQFQVAVQNTIDDGRTYGAIVKVYQNVDATDSGPSGDPLIIGDTGDDGLTTSTTSAWLLTFTVLECPPWNPNVITDPDGISNPGNWISVTYEGIASGPDEDNATHTANGPAAPLSNWFMSVDDRMWRLWPNPGPPIGPPPFGFFLRISE